MIHCMMYDTSIDVHSSLPADLQSIVLLLTSILFAVILTAELDFLVWHAIDCTGKLPGELQNNNSKHMFCTSAFVILCAFFVFCY